MKRIFAALALTVAMATPAGAAMITYAEGGVVTDIPGLTGFVTSGANMDGMQVTACFSIAGCQPTLAWADRVAPGSGGVAGAGWDLSLTGDSFTEDWIFEMSADLGQLVSLLLDGSTGFVLFDRTEPNTGTPGSAQGRDWTTTLNDGTMVDVTYLDPTGIGGADPVGDIFQRVLIEFGMTGPRGDFTFMQDTDNDSRAVVKVPEPGSLMLLGLAGLALAAVRRRRA